MVYTVLYIRVMRLNTRSLDLPYDALNIRSPLNSFITFAKRISIHTGVYSYSTEFIQERWKDIFSFISLNCIQVVVSGLTLIYPSYLDSISCIRIPMTITLGKWKWNRQSVCLGTPIRHPFLLRSHSFCPPISLPAVNNKTSSITE